MDIARRISGASRTGALYWLALAVAVWFLAISEAQAGSLPAGFQETTVFTGLTEPTTIRFASDGRIFVAEKSGLLKVFPNLSTNTPTVVADLRTNVHNFWDRGFLGMALDPNFPATPYIYVLYAYDAVPGGGAPRWGTVGGTSDDCPTPPARRRMVASLEVGFRVCRYPVTRWSGRNRC